MTNKGIIVRQRDIVLIPFPFADSSENKKRPVIIISDSKYNTCNEDVICCAITSNTRAYHNSVDINNNDLDEGYLQYYSRIKSTKIFTLEQKSILKKLARLNVPKSKEVITQLNNNIAVED